jgi:phytanoyl-CoA hydroxylase
MNHELTDDQIEAYRRDGFVVKDPFLDPDELEHWRSVVGHAVASRHGARFAGQTSLVDEIRESDDAGEFYDRVFDQLVNLWQSDSAVADLILDERIGEMAARLAGVGRVRIWHDQALIKQPYANPTAFHLDAPYWSFTSRDAISIWVALDDANEANGCLYFFPGSHLETTTENVKIGTNVGAIFDVYPQFRRRPAASGAMRAGSCSFHSGMTIHGAGANMSAVPRRAMTAAFMPDGCTFNGQQNILTDEQVGQLHVGDPLTDPTQNPLVSPPPSNEKAEILEPAGATTSAAVDPPGVAS